LLNKKNAEDYFDETTWDTLPLTRLKLIENPKFNLASCLQAHEIDIVDAHRALTDTIATAKLFIKYIKNLRNDSDSVNKQEKRFRHTFEF
jgi:DNA polymerase III alpha subunit (gram-positive type)